MSISRRDLLRRSAVLPALALAESFGVKSLFAGTGVPARNLIVVELQGGNDGLNSFVPFGVNGGAYYDYRSALAVPESKLLKIGGQPIGFHPKLKELHARYLAGQLALIQGVGYPNPNLSHDYSARIWRAGVPGNPGTVGWIGRYLSKFAQPTFPFATEIGDTTTLLTAGAPGEIPAIGILEAYKFPFDYMHSEDSLNRRKAYEKMVDASLAQTGLAQSVGATGAQLLELIDTLKTIPPLTSSVTWPPHGFALQLQIVLRLLKAGLGLRFFRVQLGNFDTHANQNKDGFHAKLLEVLSKGLDALLTELSNNGLGANTLVLVTSEFGRTLRENLSLGTDHGTVGPVIALGPGVNGGVFGAHPSLNPAQLDPTGELAMSVDFRDVLGTVLLRWLGESPASVAQLLPGYAAHDLGFLD